MSALGQEWTSKHVRATSALPPKADIEQWRASLPDKQRRRLQGQHQNVRHWRKATGKKMPAGRDDAAMALAAWRCFVSRVKALPTEQAAPVRQAILAEAAAVAHA